MRSSLLGACALALLAGCAGSGPAPYVATGEGANVHVHVSNQSFEQPWADLLVTLDEVPLFDGRAHVAGQHNWTLAEAQAAPGRHTLAALERDSGASKEHTFHLPQGEERWLVVNYWGEGEDAYFSITIHDEPVAFA